MVGWRIAFLGYRKVPQSSMKDKEVIIEFYEFCRM